MIPNLQDALLALATLTGHLLLGIAILNRLHALPLPCRMISITEKLIFLLIVLVPSAALWNLSSGGRLIPLPAADARTPFTPALLYAGLCWLTTAAWSFHWLRRHLKGPCAALVSNDTEVISISEQLGHKPLGTWMVRLLERIPGNQILTLHVHEKTLRLARLPAPLEGLKIAHLSDLHLTGQLEQPFYDLIVDRTNALQSDLVVISGDIIDKVRCIEWLGPTLGRLRAPHGVYFVLGNHDAKIRDVGAIRRALVEAGLEDLGGRSKVLEINGVELLLAGNERPWFRELPELPPPAEPFRMLVAHTPDQLAWARKNGFDLMLAGHTHGGQVRLPLIGPLLAPSLHGVKYASGLFHEPPTLMHVSRGIAGMEPLRINCPPELAQLILQGESAE